MYAIEGTDQVFIISIALTNESAQTQTRQPIWTAFEMSNVWCAALRSEFWLSEIS